jgi:hypothetical protein
MEDDLRLRENKHGMRNHSGAKKQIQHSHDQMSPKGPARGPEQWITRELATAACLPISQGQSAGSKDADTTRAWSSILLWIAKCAEIRC